MLGLAVGVEGFQQRDEVVAVVVALLAEAVGGGAGGVQKRDVLPGAKAPDLLGIVEVEAVENGGVFFRGVSAGAEVEDELDGGAIFFEPGQEFVPVDFGVEVLAFEVAVFIGPAEIVHEDNLRNAFVI